MTWRVEQESGPEALYDEPASVFAAEFAGASNILECEAVQASGGEVELRVRAPGPLAGPVAVLLRPHVLSLATGTQPAGPGVWPGVIRERAYQGIQWQYRVEVQGAVLAVWSSGRFRQGEAVMVRCPPGAARALSRAGA